MLPVGRAPPLPSGPSTVSGRAHGVDYDRPTDRAHTPFHATSPLLLSAALSSALSSPSPTIRYGRFRPFVAANVDWLLWR